ncbi:ABC transporter ATP-binding protein [Lentzea aerocolonigenes]|uniref:ABC transporter ATP-binding protein n=1 Tax=Lentzea aerocolonigenes TaxID=68170 RepID=UPI0004C435B9|nr:ABC transporter ATP-binding protein [Lentzea aerocolonigenes]MCP2246716.1 putative spermidine/putrescine transport system ATP-binding protein [Lentzea aerocolonigenes]
MAGQRFAELHLDRVQRAFGDTVALKGMDLTIKGGEFVALLGPSGCGKSTALNCLAGLLPLTGGRITLDGKRIDDLPPEKRGFGMVFQNYALFPHMSVRRNIGFGLSMRKTPKQELARRVDEAVRLVQLEEHQHKFPAQLSGGQQQRVAIARAIVLEPPLVLMDEPLSNLDAALRLEMRTEIRRLHQSLGLTTVYVTHDQEEALALADRLVVLRLGEVQQVGSPEEVYAHPVNRYVAGFMGYRNMIPVTVTAQDDEHATVRADGVELVGVKREELGAQAVAAVRPEDFTVVAEVGANTLEAVVEIVEYHGREQAVEARLGDGSQLHVRTTSRLAPGDAIRLRVPVERVLVFA